MNTSYQNVLERLKEERLNKQLSQLEMGQIMRMSQSHYSKAELGVRRFSYYETQYLCESEVDSYFIFTGKRCVDRYKHVWERCSYDELVNLFYILCLSIEHLCLNCRGHKCQEIHQDIRYIKYIIALDKKNNNIFYNLRRSLGYNQLEMSKVINVDVKKLRDLENGRVLPDSEIIWCMYNIYNIPPALFVKSRMDLATTIDDLLSAVEPELEKLLFSYLEQLCELGINNEI